MADDDGTGDLDRGDQPGDEDSDEDLTNVLKR